MNPKRTLLLTAAVLLAEAVAVVALPARVPRAVRAIGAAVNGVAAIGLLTLARQRGRRG